MDIHVPEWSFILIGGLLALSYGLVRGLVLIIDACLITADFYGFQVPLIVQAVFFIATVMVFWGRSSGN
ncbi:MAG: hypothetical protein ACXV7J_00170 [Methylomonas sp.]